MAQAVLVVAVLWTVWFPAETMPGTATVLAAVMLGLVPWAWARTSPAGLQRWVRVLPAVFVVLLLSAASGWDRAAAVQQLGLAAAVLAVFFVASRKAPDQQLVRLFALGIALLSLWALWQVLVGFEKSLTEAAELPEPARTFAINRLEGGRGFASLILPGHLAVLLATAFTLLVSGLRFQRRAVPAWVGCGLCVLGLALSFSPLGIALAAAACAVLLLRKRKALAAVVVVVLVIALAGAFVFRDDLADLEPLRLRLHNWRTAVWLYTTAPVAGVGLGSYGQASQSVPFEVGNRPAHAHCMPLELLAELGVLGLGFVLMAGWWLLVRARALYRVRPEMAAALLIVPMHNLADFSIYTSCVALPWALIAGWSAAGADQDPALPTAPPGRVWAVTAAALMLVLTTLHGTSEMVERAALVADSSVEVMAGGQRAHQLAPWRVGPVVVVAEAAIRSGDRQAAVEAEGVLAVGRRLRPRSGAFAAYRAQLAWIRGRVPEALSAARCAVLNQPHNPLAAELERGLMRQLRQTDDESED